MRNYKNELNWRKEKYFEIHTYIERDLGEKLKQKLEKNNQTMANWITEKAREYLTLGNKKKL